MRNPITWLLVLQLSVTPSVVQAAITTPLSEGMNSVSVTELQQALAWEGYFSVEPTGYFGPVTRDALASWQRDHGLIADGVFDSVDNRALVQSVMLREGVSGAAVTSLQDALRRTGYFNEESTGYFGTLTKAALSTWQQDNGLPVTGNLTRDEWQRLNLSAPTSSLSYSNEELQLLARLIEAEAGGESYLGKVAVAAVVFNRVKNAQFPNTISEVIYQRYQFEPVSNGRIYSAVASADSLNAARAALAGEDPTSGALFFHNPITASSSWMQARSVQKQIGNHVFS